MFHHLTTHYFVQNIVKSGSNLVDISNYGDPHGLMCDESESCSL